VRSIRHTALRAHLARPHNAEGLTDSAAGRGVESMERAGERMARRYWVSPALKVRFLLRREGSHGIQGVLRAAAAGLQFGL
jgi:hypothetical protein